MKSESIRRRRSGGENRLAFELLGSPATDADHVVVVAMVRSGELEATSSLTQLQLLKKAHVREQAQGAVHGREGDFHLPMGQLLMDVLRAEVASGSQPFEEIQHSPPLRRQPTATLMQALLQSTTFRDRRRGYGQRCRAAVLNSNH